MARNKINLGQQKGRATNYKKYVERTNDNFLTGIRGKPGKDAVQLPIPAIVTSKQDQLVSGVNIKTINGDSILGSGNINIEGGQGNSYFPTGW
jgi:hypothetical protein